MRHVLGTLLLAATLSMGQTKSPAKDAAPPVAKKLTPDELQKLMEKRNSVFFLDVREPDEIQNLGSLPGYVNIPLGQLESRLGELPKDKPIITACSHGVRAGRAAALLEKNGFKVLGACGMKEWKKRARK